MIGQMMDDSADIIKNESNNTKKKKRIKNF